MRISTEIESLAVHMGEEKAVESLAKAGFDGWDFSLAPMCKYDRLSKSLLPTDHPLASSNYLTFARQLKRIGEDNGIVCNQSHAPFPPTCPPIRDRMKRAIECTAEAGGKLCVIHPYHLESPEFNAEFYGELLPFAKDCGIQIATENMLSKPRGSDRYYPAACSTPDRYLAQLAAVNDPDFVACLDIGHAEVVSSAVDLIHALGDHLQALHLHDNDKAQDLHLLPFTGAIDFVPIVKALKEIGYKGWFTLEADRFLKQMPSSQVPQGIKTLAATAKHLADMFDEA